MDQPRQKNLQTHLLAWFESHRRPLPWRLNPSLYGIWVSEIMLQQTTVTAVIPFWEKFMQRFPDVGSLAKATEGEVLALWSGLGYYRRAKNLHLAARTVMTELGGKLPTSRKSWLALSGVGVYASGAIASIGLAEPVPAVDANAKRVLSRWFFDDPVLAGNLRPAQLEELGASMVFQAQPGRWNEAVMELGATLCKAHSAECGQCPVLDQCRAGLAGVALDIPPAKKSKPSVQIALASLVIRYGDHLLLLPPGNPEQVSLAGTWDFGRTDISGLHQGFWTLPTSPWYLASPKVKRALEKANYVRHWLEQRLNFSPGEIRSSGLRMASFGHSITRYRLDVRVWEVQLPENMDFAKIEEQFPGSFVLPSTNSPVSQLVNKSLARFL